MQSLNGLGFFERAIHLVSVLHDIPLEDVEDMDAPMVYKLLNEVRHETEIHDNNVTKFGEYNLVKFEQITFGQFIDLETWVTNSWHDNFSKIVAALYLKSNYNGDEITARESEIDEMEVNLFYGAVRKYLSWRVTFYEAFGLWESKEEQEQIDPYEDEPNEPKPYQPNQWLSLLNTLTDNDITKFEQVMALNVYLVYNQLTYLRNQTKSDVPTL